MIPPSRGVSRSRISVSNFIGNVCRTTVVDRRGSFNILLSYDLKRLQSVFPRNREYEWIADNHIHLKLAEDPPATRLVWLREHQERVQKSEINTPTLCLVRINGQKYVHERTSGRFREIYAVCR
jgi:hypothetical protein